MSSRHHISMEHRLRRKHQHLHSHIHVDKALNLKRKKKKGKHETREMKNMKAKSPSMGQPLLTPCPPSSQNRISTKENRHFLTLGTFRFFFLVLASARTTEKKEKAKRKKKEKRNTKERNKRGKTRKRRNKSKRKNKWRKWKMTEWKNDKMKNTGKHGKSKMKTAKSLKISNVFGFTHSLSPAHSSYRRSKSTNDTPPTPRSAPAAGSAASSRKQPTFPRSRLSKADVFLIFSSISFFQILILIFSFLHFSFTSTSTSPFPLPLPPPPPPLPPPPPPPPPPPLPLPLPLPLFSFIFFFFSDKRRNIVTKFLVFCENSIFGPRWQEGGCDFLGLSLVVKISTKALTMFFFQKKTNNPFWGLTESATFGVNASRAIPTYTFTNVKNPNIFILFLEKKRKRNKRKRQENKKKTNRKNRYHNLWYVVISYHGLWAVFPNSTFLIFHFFENFNFSICLTVLFFLSFGEEDSKNLWCFFVFFFLFFSLFFLFVFFSFFCSFFRLFDHFHIF